MRINPTVRMEIPAMKTAIKMNQTFLEIPEIHRRSRSEEIQMKEKKQFLVACLQTVTRGITLVTSDYCDHMECR